jgi:hypothetical protein
MASLQSRPRASTLAVCFEREPFMLANFQSTMTEADFKRPLLDATEDRLARETRGEVDLAVEGLTESFLSRLIRLFSRETAARR